MSYDELLAQVYAALPQLKGQLHAPRVVYVQSQGKVYITFESNVLVEEASFLKLEALLRRVFPQKPLALRVVSPGLKDDFLENISAYKQVLTDFLRTGRYDRRRPFYKTTSPSMDILVSSNLERLLSLLTGDDAYVAGLMKQLNERGHYKVSDELLKKLKAEFSCGCCDDDEYDEEDEDEYDDDEDEDDDDDYSGEVYIVHRAK